MISLSFSLWLFSSFLVALLAKQPKLLVITMDGFRWDYLSRFNTPNFDRLISDGVIAEYMEPVFPSVTLANMYTHFTGLYPDFHGIVSNNFHDRVKNATFLLHMTNDAPKWLDVNPVWITMHSQNMKFASLPQKFTPKFKMNFDLTLANGIVNQALNLLLYKDFNVVWGYFPEPDYSGHVRGPYTLKLKMNVLDKAIGNVMAILEKANATNKINIIIVGDHGMSYTPTENKIEVQQCLDKDNIKVTDIYGETFGMVYVPRDMVDKTFISLSNCHPNLKVYKKSDLPKRWHYGSHQRIGEIILLADEGWYLVHKNIDKSQKMPLGTHGYDNKLESMRTIFLARGPSFRRNATVSAFSSIHLYAIICHVAGVQAQQNNGSIHGLQKLFRNPPSSSVSMASDIAVLFVYVISVVLY